MASQFPRENPSCLFYVPTVLVLLILATSVSNLVIAQSQALMTEPENNFQSEVTFEPDENLTFVEKIDTGILQVPRNHTITEADLSLSSIWNSVPYQNSTFGQDQTFLWNGSVTNVEQSSTTQNLILERVNTANTVNNFEVSSPVPSDGWLGSGPSGDVWTIVQNNSTLVSASNMNLPNSGYDNTSFLSTTGNGDINSNIEACISSPLIDVPKIINNYSLSFLHWMALESSDEVTINFLDASNMWSNLPFSSTITSNPNSNNWQLVNISLDSYFSHTSASTRLQFCVKTSQVSVDRGGWFIDEVSLFNEGGSKGAWFHGNFSGDYLPNSISEFIIPANLTNFPYLDELEINANWDIQGYLHDYLTVEYSFDNGTTWNTISGNYGIPGLGIWHNGNRYYGESNGWVPIYLPIGHNFTNSGGLNHTLFKFTVFTNAGVNYGGAASSGWEGIAIDRLIFHHNRGTINSQQYVFKDFNSPPSVGLNSTDGWLTNRVQTPNQWQWTQNMGLYSQHSQIFSFNDFDELPLGWAVSSQDENKWTHGEIPARAIYGPDAWSSGQYGIGIELDGKYVNEMYTHLVSPEYSIPSSASARLTFNSWVCTEANWDGGAVSVSTDGGINWWYLPARIGDFHDQISSVNTNSPFFGEGILDGSTIANGCRNSSLPFQIKEYDISNLSGSEVRFRFSFFSDQLIELDGWYVDDVGIEIDVFKQSGNWVSQPIYPDENFGWAQIDGLVSEPIGTRVVFDVLNSSSGLVIDGYSNLTLPIDLSFGTTAVPSIQIKAKLSSDSRYVTPEIERIEMGVASYFDSYHLVNLLHQTNLNQDLVVDQRGNITTSALSELSISTDFTCPSIDAKITSFGRNVSYRSDYFSVDYTNQQTDSTVVEFDNQFLIPTLADNVSFTLDDTSSLIHFQYIPQCVLPSKNIAIGMVDSTNELYSDVTYPGLSSIFQTETFSSVMIDDISQTPDDFGQYDITLAPGQILNLSYHLLDFDNPQPTIDNAAMKISAEITSDTSGELRLLNSNEIIAQYELDRLSYEIVRENNCQNRGTSFDPVGGNVGIIVCTLSLYTSTEVEIKVNHMLAISSVSNLTIDLAINQLNSIKHALENASTAETIDFPISVNTDFGSVTTKFAYKSYLHQIDRIIDLDKEQWLPGEELSVQTSHWRFNPVSMSYSEFGFDSVQLTASIDSTNHEKRFTVEAIDLGSDNPSFNTVFGGEKVSIIAAKTNVSCNGGFCLVNWTLQSTWHLDDVNNVAWMVNSTDFDGLVTGPAVLIRDTRFNEIENDLEIFELSVVDSTNNIINDWTNQNWPYRISQQNNLTVSGTVRFEGINSPLLDENDAEVEIRLTALPPINASDEPDGWDNNDVGWSSAWFTDISKMGYFTKEITTPNIGDVPSNTTIQLSVHISRVGPIDEASDTALDQTPPSMNTRFIFDVASPSIAAINVYNPNGLIPADNLVWTLNQDIPIQVIIEDIEGLGTELMVYSWSEYTDDTNGDSVMDKDEYRVTTVSVNYASNVAVLDIPAFSWQEVKGPFESGRLSLVFEMEDLAGNELLLGGNFGEFNDAATIFVQDQFQTLMDTSSLSLDLVNNSLLPSYQHAFTYSITDYNGITSLDKISLALVGRESPNLCNIDYFPRTAYVQYDVDCFSHQPVVEISQIFGLQKWFVTTKFVIDWEIAQTNSNLSGIPSLKLFDDGQDLQLGTSYIRGLSWDIEEVVTVDNIQLIDRVSPFGYSSDGELWANPGDVITSVANLFHNDSRIQLNNLSPQDQIGCHVNNDTQLIESIYFEDGLIKCEFTIPNNSVHDSFQVELWSISKQGNYYSSEVGVVHTDKSRPLLLLELRDLLRLYSSELNSTFFAGTVIESSDLIHQELVVNWNIIRDGSVQNGMPYTRNISLTRGVNNTYQFGDFINLTNTPSNTIIQGDELMIWLTLQDNSGQEMFGFGTTSEPLLPTLTWSDFDPRISLVDVRTENPMDGESVKILTRIVNQGLESGNVKVNLFDNSSRLLATRTVELDGGEWELIEWDIEAWTTGDIEIIISLENYSRSQSVVVENVEEFESKQQDLLGTVGLVVIFLIIVVGGFSYSYIQRSKELEQYTKHHLDQIAIRKQEMHRSSQPTESILEEE